MVRPAVLPDPAPAAAESGWWAVCLCAEWCGTCRDYRAVFEALAQEHAGVRFVWVDIEDESDLAGDLDVETFPTLLIADGRTARFLGPLLPQAGVLSRLLESLRAAQGGAGAGPQAQAVFERVRAAHGGA
ncbi:thioredoxin family protein [Simplicispira lacusdiani]|uniref:thioredoxin family protein n=1 Tax=Simplicispira lacusdiani TaxID=2213010 RepID=UPI000E74B08A|nr:thioredoxin family protein [Simplicispira lacusdiani]